jgi:hypothetical protein
VHDEYRIRADVPPDGVRAVLAALQGLELSDELRKDIGRAAVTHDGNEIFIYTDSEDAAGHAREALERAVADAGVKGQVTAWRWHHLEERWEDASAPLPASAAEQAQEDERLTQAEDAQSRARGYPEWEVRVTLPSRSDAREFAERLEHEDIPVLRRWRHLFVGADDEVQAKALSDRLRAEAPPGTELSVEGAGPDAVWAVEGPFAAFGGL